MSAVAGLRGTGDWGTDERPKNFREGILRFNPNGSAPIFALSSKGKKGKPTNDPEFSWWCEGNTIIRLQVNGALTSSATTVVVDTADPTSTTLGANYGTATHLKAGDILLVEPSADNATFDHELLEVDDVVSDTQFTVRRGAGGTTPAAISNDIWLTVIGSAYAEGTGAPRATTKNPIKFSNYTQIFKDSYELSGTADKTKTRTNNNYSEDKKRKMHKHSADIEFSLLFGRSAETTGDNGKPKRFMAGLRSFIPSANTTIFSSATTRNSFFDAIAPIFDFDTGAGDTRMGFAGRDALLALSKLFADEVVYNVNNKVTQYGMDFFEFTLPNGRVMMKSHPLMSRHTLYQKAMFIVDFDAFAYVPMVDRDTKAHDDVQNEDEDVRRGFIQTECSCSVDFGGLTMAYLGNIHV